jgi:hypothetical protein
MTVGNVQLVLMEITEKALWCPMSYVAFIIGFIAILLKLLHAYKVKMSLLFSHPSFQTAAI